MWWNACFGPLDPFAFADMKPRLINKFKNNNELQNRLMTWTNTAINMYKWNGLTDSMSERMLELSFLLRGSAMIAEINGAYYTLACNPGSDYTMYGEPTKAFGTGFNGFNREFRLYIPGADEGKLLRETTGLRASMNYEAVLGWDNKARYPYINYIINSCLRAADIKRSEDVVRNNMKKPAIVTCEESMVNSVKQAFKDKDDNNEVIVIALGNFSPESIKVWDLKVDPSILKEFADAGEREENYLREVFGLNALPNADKRERLITDEANANNEATKTNGDIRLIMREQFCEHVNTAFDLNLSVELRVKPEEFEVEEEPEDVDMEQV